MADTLNNKNMGKNIGDIQSLLITYEASQMKDYLCLATFLSLCGFPIVARRETTSESMVGSNYGCDIAVRFKENTEVEDSQTDVYITPEMTKNQGVLNVLLHKLHRVHFLTDDTFDLLYNVANDVYKKYDLRKAEYTGQYYFYVRNEAESSMKKYYMACKEVRNLQEQYGKQNWRLWFIRGQFMRRIQSLAGVNQQEEPYNVSMYISKLEELFEEHPDNYMLSMLMGNLASTSKSTYKHVGDYYHQCIAMFNDSGSWKIPYLSDTYYRLGHWYESQKMSAEAYTYFRMSYEADPENYRAIYKIARHLEVRERDYDEAWRYYGMIQRMLEETKDAKCIQPFENEYLFKVYYCKRGMIKDGKVPKSSKLIAFDECLRNMELQKPEEAYFLQQFFGDDYKKYYDYMIDRISGFRKQL